MYGKRVARCDRDRVPESTDWSSGFSGAARFLSNDNGIGGFLHRGSSIRSALEIAQFHFESQHLVECQRTLEIGDINVDMKNALYHRFSSLYNTPSGRGASCGATGGWSSIDCSSCSSVSSARKPVNARFTLLSDEKRKLLGRAKTW